MAQTRTLVRETDRVKVYEIREVDGTLVCTSEEPILTVEENNAATLRDRARQALQANAAYLALAAPTNAQVAQQVGRLTRETSAVIRLLLDQHDTTDGT
jgi:hypothetical protein